MQTRVDDVPATAEARREVALEPGSDAARTLAFLRSLRGSRSRRAAFARRRRRILRSRRSSLLAAAGLVILSAGAIAQQAAPGSGTSLSSGTLVAAQRALGVTADGVAGPRTRAATKRFQRANGLTVDGIIGPQTLRALGIDADAQTVQAAGLDPLLAQIAQCESSGDPTAVSASGQYRGKYQFSMQTWREMGGTGDPAAAPEADQDAIAAKLLAQAGTRPWPNCA